MSIGSRLFQSFLKPLEERSLESSLISCLARAEGLTETDSTALLHYAHTPRARQRLLQYLLSSIVGHHFIDRMKLSVSRSLRFSFDMRETDRHYGPWLHDSMKVLTSCERLVPDPQILKDAEHPKPGVTPAALPLKVREWATSSLRRSNNAHQIPHEPSLFRSDEITNLIPDFSEIFLSHYDKRELPARREALKLGDQVLLTSDVLSHRNRLEMGLPWPVIIEHLLSLHDVKPTPEVEQVFSLVLDFCNDQGIAVAITCLVDNVVFRAYRHGEDV